METMYHNSVLLKESINSLVTNPNGTYVDLTYGGGGHSAAILDCLTQNGRLISFDIDEDACKNYINDNRFVLVNQNFRYLWNYLRYYDVIPVDGIFADLGTSSHQIDIESRGFSMMKECPLDMRMNTSSTISAKHVVNTYSLEKLTEIFRNYGELDNAYYVASAIVKSKNIMPVDTTTDLKNIVIKYSPRNKEYKFLAQVFQAIRIEVNKELDALEEVLMQLEMLLKTGGRAAFITYHSLEDRLVKNMFKSGNIQGEIKKDFFGNKICPFKHINKKPITPTDNEIKTNSRARSAKLRTIEKI